MAHPVQYAVLIVPVDDAQEWLSFDLDIEPELGFIFTTGSDLTFKREEGSSQI